MFCDAQHSVVMYLFSLAVHRWRHALILLRPHDPCVQSIQLLTDVARNFSIAIKELSLDADATYFGKFSRMKASFNLYISALFGGPGTSIALKLSDQQTAKCNRSSRLSRVGSASAA
jgi:hypothetical protein